MQGARRGRGPGGSVPRRLSSPELGVVVCVFEVKGFGFQGSEVPLRLVFRAPLKGCYEGNLQRNSRLDVGLRSVEPGASPVVSHEHHLLRGCGNIGA